MKQPCQNNLKRNSEATSWCLLLVLYHPCIWRCLWSYFWGRTLKSKSQVNLSPTWLHRMPGSSYIMCPFLSCSNYTNFPIFSVRVYKQLIRLFFKYFHRNQKAPLYLAESWKAGRMNWYSVHYHKYQNERQDEGDIKILISPSQD